MSEFERENRYIVIKRKDLDKLPVNYRRHLVEPMFSFLSHLPRRKFLVIESDWPEYEVVWKMIEDRMNGGKAMSTNQTIDGVLVSRELLRRTRWELDAGTPSIATLAELRALLDAPAEQFNLQGWSIDHTAGRPILTHNNCSVIEAEQAYGLLELIKSATQPQGEND